MGIFDFLFGGAKQPAPAPAPVKEPESFVKPQVCENIEEHRARISEVLSSEFPYVEIKTNVSAFEISDICGMNINIHPACTPVDFLILKEGKPYLAIVLVRPNTYRGMNVIGTKRVCEAAGISYVRFFTNMPNEKGYISDRLKNLI